MCVGGWRHIYFSFLCLMLHLNRQQPAETSHPHSVKVSVSHTSIYLLCSGLDECWDSHKDTKTKVWPWASVCVRVHSSHTTCMCFGVSYGLRSSLNPPGEERTQLQLALSLPSPAPSTHEVLVAIVKNVSMGLSWLQSDENLVLFHDRLLFYCEKCNK